MNHAYTLKNRLSSMELFAISVKITGILIMVVLEFSLWAGEIYRECKINYIITVNGHA